MPTDDTHIGPAAAACAIGSEAVRQPRKQAVQPPISEGPLRVTAGPQAAWFGNELYSAAYQVLEESNRMGLRLKGPAIASPAGHMLTEGQMLQRGSYLIDLLHARARRSTANQNQHITLVDFMILDGMNGGLLGQENAGRADLAIDAVGSDDARIDGGALDDGTFRGEVAARECDG